MRNVITRGRMTKVGMVSTAALALSLSGCRQDPLTAEEAVIAAEESTLASQATALTASSVELTVETDFTIGQAVEEAAENIRGFIESQMPCAEVTRDRASLRVEYGARSGDCTWKGQTYSGTHEIRVESIDATAVVIRHEWVDFANDDVEVDGTATVTWSFESRSRRVQHQATWTRLSDGRSGSGSGDRTQTVLDGGLVEGIRVSGTTSWEGESGSWELAIDDVEMRWQDPVPQSGRYTLDTPWDKTVSLGFGRVDDRTIRVTLTGPRNRDFSFNVRQGGDLS